MASDFSSWLYSEGYDEAALSPTQRKHLSEAWKAESENQIDAREREIYDTAERYSRDCTDEKRAAIMAVAEKGLSEGWNTQKTSLAILREARSLAAWVTTPRSNASTPADVLCASLCQTIGVPESSLGKLFSPQVAEMAVSKQFRGASLHSALRAVLSAAGEPVPLGRFTAADVRRAFDVSRRAQEFGPMAVGAPSTQDIAGILSNVANKTALSAYQDTPVAWPTFARKLDVKDFKPTKSFRLTGSGEFTVVPPGGSLEHGSLSESEYEVQADTYGKLLEIDRRALINDDLSMLQSAPKLLGRMAAVFLEKSVFSLLLANSGSFFSSGNKNLSSGAGSALSLAGLDAALKLFREQVDGNNDPVLITPTILLTPPSLEATARSLVNSSLVIAGTTTDKEPSGNVFAGMFTPVVSPFLAESTALHSNADDASWYLMTGPTDYACVQIGFVGGAERPVIEQAELNFERLGIAMRAYHDFGVSFLDHRGAVLSVGS